MAINETVAIIKDCIFEGVMMGEELPLVLRSLHFDDGFSREDIMKAYREMCEEVGEEGDV